MDPIEALLLPVDEDEKMRALARSLRGRQVAADFFAGSTIPALQQIAQGEQEYIKDVAERQGVLREALERRKQDQAQHDAYIGLQRDLLTAREIENEKDRQLRRELGEESNFLRLALANARGRTQVKPSAKMLESQIEGKNMLGTIAGLNDIFAEMSPEQQAQVNQPWSDIASSAAEAMLPTGISRRIEEATFSDPKVREYRALGRRWEQRLSNAAAGLALTKYEIGQRDRWSPFAAGISQEERQIRIDNLQNELQQALRTRHETFPEYLPPPFDEPMAPQGGASALGQSEVADLSGLSDEELQAIINGAQ